MVSALTNCQCWLDLYRRSQGQDHGELPGWISTSDVQGRARNQTSHVTLNLVPANGAYVEGMPPLGSFPSIISWQLRKRYQVGWSTRQNWKPILYHVHDWYYTCQFTLENVSCDHFTEVVNFFAVPWIVLCYLLPLPVLPNCHSHSPYQYMVRYFNQSTGHYYCTIAILLVCLLFALNDG